MSDGFVRRSGDNYADALSALLPTGPAWTRDPDAALSQLVSGLAQVWGKVDAKAADLLEIETDPRSAYELLADWERAFGLPEPLARFSLVQSFRPFSFGPSSFGGRRGRIEPPTVRYSWALSGYLDTVPRSLPERRQALVNKITTQGGQSREFFIGIAARLGYDVAIREFRPFQFGVSSFGGFRGRIIPPRARFVWTVSVYGPRLTRFRFGSSSFGRDPILALRRAEDLEAVFRKLKPAHTEIVFRYDDVRPAKVIRFQFGDSSFGNDPILKLA